MPIKTITCLNGNDLFLFGNLKIVSIFKLNLEKAFKRAIYAIVAAFQITCSVDQFVQLSIVPVFGRELIHHQLCVISTSKMI